MEVTRDRGAQGMEERSHSRVRIGSSYVLRNGSLAHASQYCSTQALVRVHDRLDH
jgi:hypothetical protein